MLLSLKTIFIWISTILLTAALQVLFYRNITWEILGIILFFSAIFSSLPFYLLYIRLKNINDFKTIKKRIFKLGITCFLITSISLSLFCLFFSFLGLQMRFIVFSKFFIYYFLSLYLCVLIWNLKYLGIYGTKYY